MEAYTISKFENFGQFVRANCYFNLLPPYSFRSEYISAVTAIEICKTALSNVEEREEANCHPVSDPIVIIGAVVKEAEDGPITFGISFQLGKGFDNTPKLVRLYNPVEERVQVMAKAMNPLYPPLPPVDSGRIDCVTLSSVLDSRSPVSIRFRASKRRGNRRSRENALGLSLVRFKRTNRV